MAAEAGGGAGGAGGEASTAGGAPSAPSFSWSTGAAIGVAGSVVTALAIRSMLDPEGGNNARNALLNHGNFRPVTREVHEAVRLREAPPAVLAAQKGRSSPAAPRLRILRGAVPGDMRGAFVRIGPNSAPQRRPPNMHWFDGDGMAHAVCFFTPEESAGEAGVVVTYANHWLRTHKFKEESRLGRASFPGISAFWGLSGVASIGRFVWDIARRNVRPGPSSAARMDGVSTANTALVYHDRRLMALQEAAGPFVFRVLRDGMLESVGFHSYANQLKFPMTAHPKVCPETGELHFFGYQMMPGKPYMQYAVVSAGGEFLRAFDLGVKHLTMPHDFAITRQYAVIFDIPVEMAPSLVLRGHLGIRAVKTGGVRFGVLNRHTATSGADVKWYTAPDSLIISHVGNAWEEGDEIVIAAVAHSEFFIESFGFADVETLECRRSAHHTDEVKGDGWGQPTEIRINLATGVASLRPIVLGIAAEFPQTNPRYFTRQTRWLFAPVSSPAKSQFEFDQLAKVDVTGRRVVALANLGDGVCGGEPSFVPRAGGTAEDDGYLIMFAHHSAHDESSRVLIFDARGEGAGAFQVLCEVETAARVPYGFHGTWLTEDEVNAQRDTSETPKFRRSLRAKL